MFLRTNMHYKVSDNRSPLRKGQKSTFKKTNNDALTIFKVHVYLLFPKKKLIGKYPESIIQRQQPSRSGMTNELNIGIETKISNFLRHFFFINQNPPLLSMDPKLLRDQFPIDLHVQFAKTLHSTVYVHVCTPILKFEQRCHRLYACPKAELCFSSFIVKVF